MAVKGKRKWLFYPLGYVVGFLNGLFGSGGGMIGVPMLRGMGIDGDAAHATSLAIIFPLSLASGYLYLQSGHIDISEAMRYLPGGLAGAVVGAWLLPRIKTVWLNRIFGVVILWSAVQLLLR